MIRSAISVLFLALLLPPVKRIAAADPETTSKPAYYPWSETSPFVRVPKTLLEEVHILSVTITNHETMEFVLTEDFIQTFALTGPEVDQITVSTHEAIDEWRKEKVQHL